MGQAEYEAFKAKLREWMETHPEEYAAFEESMNTRDMAGCQAVLLQAIALIPQYRKLTAAKANEGLFDHVDEIEQAAQDNDLARKLIGEREQPVAGSPVPAMLCWLYFGKSFERMVEHCEELRRSPDLGYFQKHERHDPIADCPFHQTGASDPGGVESPPRSHASGRKRSGAGLGHGGVVGRQERSETQAGASGNHPLFDGDVRSNGIPSRGVAA